MLLEKIFLKNFRNISYLELDFHNNLNFLWGKNGQGKTNLLEAIYLCCIGKSPFHKEKDLILTGAEESYIKLFGKNRNGNFQLTVILSKSEKKRFYLNGLSLNKTSDILGCLNAVYFSPDSLKLIKEAPEDRRKFLDVDLSQLYKTYCISLTKYNKILLQRNNLLKNSDYSSIADILPVWDLQLIKEGSFLISKRCDFIKHLGGYAANAHRHLTSGTEMLEVSYSTNIDLSDIETSFAALLKNNLKKDFALKYTSIGPHRDDIKITSNNSDIKNFSSQGQQRTAALSLKLGEIQYFKEITGEYPVFLLDDVLSELDSSRQKKLIESILTTQCFLTATHSDIISDLDFFLFKVDAGSFEKISC